MKESDPWAQVDRFLMQTVAEVDLVPLVDCRPGPVPAAYLLYYRGSLPLYRPLVRTGEPIYVGSAKNVSRRLGEHRWSLDAVADLKADDFEVQVLILETYEAAVYAESRLIAEYRPVWNSSDFAGFGSKHQGRSRAATQRPSKWDILHPGRGWVGRRDSVAESQLDPVAKAASLVSLRSDNPEAA